MLSQFLMEEGGGFCLFVAVNSFFIVDNWVAPPLPIPRQGCRT